MTAFPQQKASLRTATVAGLTLAAGLFVALFALSWSHNLSYRESDALAERARTVLLGLESVMGDVTDCETAMRGYLLTGREDFLEPYHRAGVMLGPALDRLDRDILDPEQKSHLAAFRAAVMDKKTWVDGLVRARRERGLSAARERMLTLEGKRRMDAVRAQLSLLRRREEDLLRSRSAAEERDAGRLRRLMGAVGVFTALLLIGGGSLLIREVNRSEKMGAEAAQQARLMQFILDGIGDAVVVADADGKMTVWNPAAERILGMAATQAESPQWSKIYGTFLADMTTPCPTEELPLVKALRGEATDDVELFVRNEKLPQGRWISVTGRPLRGETAENLGGVVVFRDISFQKDSEEHLRTLNDKLAAQAQELDTANKELAAFSYSVSHDLRAPLRALDGFSQVLSEDYGPRLDSLGKEHLNRIQKAARRMGQLIDDLLALSKVSRAELTLEPLDLSALAEAVAADLAQREPSRAVRFQAPAGIKGTGDARLLRVALENLLGNAWKYTAKNPAAAVEFGSVVTQDGGRSYFVRDNGAGFDMAYAHKLFGAFQRLHSDAEFAGSGIGLATVARVIQRHRGKVWAEGAVGKGATLYFTLGPG